MSVPTTRLPYYPFIVLQEPDPNRPDYPPLKAEEVRVLKVIANTLFISESAIQWMYCNAQRGDKDAGRKVLAVLAGHPVKMVVG